MLPLFFSRPLVAVFLNIALQLADLLRLCFHRILEAPNFLLVLVLQSGRCLALGILQQSQNTKLSQRRLNWGSVADARVPLATKAVDRLGLAVQLFLKVSHLLFCL